MIKLHSLQYRRTGGLAHCKAVFGLLCVVLGVAVPKGVAAEGESLRVIMLTFGESPYADEQFRAIRAQLSGTPLSVVRQGTPVFVVSDVDKRDIAADAARETEACLVFWIEDGDAVRTFYFIPDGKKGRLLEKTLDIEEASGAGRQELIAVATAGMVEKLFVTRQITALPPNTAEKPEPTPSAPPGTAPQAPKIRDTVAAISAGYCGAYLSGGTFVHGIQIGADVFPVRHLSIAAAFSQMFPEEIPYDDLTLTLTSRMVEIAAAARWHPASVEIHLGVAAIVDLRSYAANSPSGVFQEVRDGLRVTVSLMPFVSLEWVFAGRFGLFAGVGASVGLNETAYEFSLDDARTVFFTPFRTKLQIFSGLVIKI